MLFIVLQRVQFNTFITFSIHFLLCRCICIHLFLHITHTDWNRRHFSVSAGKEHTASRRLSTPSFVFVLQGVARSVFLLKLRYDSSPTMSNSQHRKQVRNNSEFQPICGHRFHKNDLEKIDHLLPTSTTKHSLSIAKGAKYLSH